MVLFELADIWVGLISCLLIDLIEDEVCLILGRQKIKD